MSEPDLIHGAVPPDLRAAYVRDTQTGEVLNVKRQTLKRFYAVVGAVTGRQKRRARKALNKARREETQ